MAFHNINWTAVPMEVGTYTINDLGNGISASTVHQIFCTSNGSITISAMGGGTFTWAAISGQKIDVVCSNIIVTSGSFVGFKTAFQPNYIQSLNG